ncbi:hypothetical protein A5320_16395 [Rheinheimera sp. SA_1]|uniref:hypothetical protein n=1 Tax=Rheinheimera sp. SA_1 TaxID=1827365 RepID=UPI0007FBBD01|nr:hypothetical protein [Rheinheimera sp. SA_1]OBP14214.1 hypothetical protein A5320_16395 [Rheinheimera sp. SA_1]
MKLVLKVGVVLAMVLLAWAYWPGSDSVAVELAKNALEQQNPQSSAGLPPRSESTAPYKPSITTNPTDTTQTCPSAEQLGTSLQKLQQQRVSLTNQLIDLHIKQGIKKPVTLQTLQVVGGDLEVFQFRQAARKENFAYFKQQFRHINFKVDKDTFFNVQAAIGKQDYDQLLQLIQQHDTADRPYLFTQMELSLLGRVVIANPQIPFSTIQQFIDAGIQPFIGDLAAFTALDLPLPLIDMVQQHYKDDLQQQWQDNFRAYNLTLLAAENSSAELFDYWRALGIPASIDPQAPNAFDLIPLPTSEQQLDQQISKVRTLLTAGILPRSADVRSQWLLLLPEQESQHLSELLQQQPAMPIEKGGPDATPLLALQQLQTEFNQLLQQVAACPTAQQWPVGAVITRDLPERAYLTNLKMQQQSSQYMKDLSAEDLDNTKKMSALIQQKDWQGLQDLMRQQQEIPAEDVDVTVMMFMMMFNASSEDVQQHLGNFKQISSEQAKQLSGVASPAHRELFKAAGFILPYNAEAEKLHQIFRESEQYKKKAEQRRSSLQQQ